MPPIVIGVAMHNYVDNLNGILHLCTSQVVDASILINYDILRQISWLMIIFGESEGGTTTRDGSEGRGVVLVGCSFVSFLGFA